MKRIPGVTYWGSIPVPYVAAWSSETGCVIRRDPVVQNRPAIFRTGLRGSGKPVFGKFDESRVRRCLVQKLCQVCALPFKHHRPIVADVAVSDRPLILNEPPCCERCFKVARAECPGIERLRKHTRFVYARVNRFDVMLSTMKAHDGGSEELNEALRDWKGEPPIGVARIVLLDFEPLVWGELQ